MERILTEKVIMNTAGFEPTASASGGQRSIQLSYVSRSGGIVALPAGPVKIYG